MATFALSLPILTGAAGLSFEYGNALVVRTVNQRIADAAAISAAIAFSSGATNDAAGSMTNAAKRIATLNGLDAAQATAAVVASPNVTTRNAVRVTITQNVPLVVSALFTKRSQLTVSVDATAELVSGAPNCILALDGASTGVRLSGGTNITANNCGVASNNQVRIDNCGPYIQSAAVTYNTSVNVPTNCGGSLSLRRANGTALTPERRAVTDPYAGTSPVTTATGRLATVAAQAAPAAPVVTVASGGNPVTFTASGGASDIAATVAQAASNGCQAQLTGSIWYYDCPAGSNTRIGAITIGGGRTVAFNTRPNISSAANVLNINSNLTSQAGLQFGNGTYNINGNLTTATSTTFNGSALNTTGFLRIASSGTHTFGPGTYNLALGLFVAGSAIANMGAGTYRIGRSTTVCASGHQYSICNGSTLTIAGPSVFELAGGIRPTGGARATLGSGSNNSYIFGPGTDGNAIFLEGGAQTLLADATSSGNLFQIGGRVSTAGGTCLQFGAAPQHDISGSIFSAGAIRLGAGVYTVTGAVNFGGGGGGDVSCGGATIGLEGVGVTIVIGGTANQLATSGGCSGTSFCLGAGYATVSLTALGTGNTTAGFSIIGPQAASNTARALFTSGAGNTRINGIFHVPNGAIDIDGGASTGDTTGGCLELIGRSVTVTQGGVLGSTCISSGGATNFTARLVQ